MSELWELVGDTPEHIAYSLYRAELDLRQCKKFLDTVLITVENPVTTYKEALLEYGQAKAKVQRLTAIIVYIEKN